MSIFKAQSVYKEFPALTIVERKTRKIYTSGKDQVDLEVVELTADENLWCEDVVGLFNINSVVSYALECNDDPILAYERARQLNHELYWISANCTTISDSNVGKDIAIKVELDGGKIYRFEGKLWTIVKQPNDNIGLVPYDI